jgi:hypothetical protein
MCAFCRATVDPSCLAERSSDACVNTLVDELLAQDAAAAAAAGGKGSNTAGIAAGAAVAGAAGGQRYLVRLAAGFAAA